MNRLPKITLNPITRASRILRSSASMLGILVAFVVVRRDARESFQMVDESLGSLVEPPRASVLEYQIEGCDRDQPAAADERR